MATQETSSGSSDVTTPDTTVLFVDDEPGLLEVYELLCQSEYTVLTAQGAKAGLSQFGDHVDFAFFDRRMPDMSGEEMIRTLRENGYRTPVGIISAVSPDNELDADYDAYLTKPIDKAQIQEAVAEHTS